MKVGFFCAENPYDRRPQSGTTFKVREALENAGVEIIDLKGHIGWFHTLLLKGQNFVTRISGIPFCGRRSLWSLYLFTKSRNEKLERECDVIFCPFTQIYPGVLSKPYVIMADATYDCLLNYYIFTDKNKRVVETKQRNDKISMNGADQFIISSDWGAESAHNKYGLSLDKINVIEFGANIDEKDIIPHEFEYEGNLNLLFLGVDWKRKGGSIAVDTCEWLNKNGVKATLHIVGIKELDENIKSLPFVAYHGFLNKNNPYDYIQLVNIIQKSHCLLLPTLAECSAISYCEASAYGLPIFSHKTGGVSNYVINGKNGYTLNLGSTGGDFGKIIKHTLESGELKKMSETAKEVYRNKLNWETWAQRTLQVFEKAINNTK